jgi:UDP-hydrolysing UDP-N-acetyl-D-glucosamine 2-epimerase
MLRLDLQKPTLLVTFHPVTLQLARTEQHVAALLAALEKVGGNIVFTYPGADAEHERIVGAVQHFVRRHAGARLVTSLGTAAYFSLMRYAAAMVGNSSSGIIEAASLELPVVNVGDRQRGRPHGENVIDADCTVAEIVRAVERATEPSFRRRLRGMSNPYGDGDAATRIVERLRTVDLDERLLIKRFHDLPELRRKAA